MNNANIASIQVPFLTAGTKLHDTEANSYATQIAVLTHFLHNGIMEGIGKSSSELKEEVKDSIHAYLDHNGMSKKYTDAQIENFVAHPTKARIFDEFIKVPFRAPKSPKFTFIDLFAGIGGFRIAMQNLGGKCLFTSEFDQQAQKSYLANYGDMPFGDITKESTKAYIPKDFDVLCAGFPCQAFSIAGRRLGFSDLQKITW